MKRASINLIEFYRKVPNRNVPYILRNRVRGSILFKFGLWLCPVVGLVGGLLGIWQSVSSDPYVSPSLLGKLLCVGCVPAFIGSVILWTLPSVVNAQLVSDAKASDYLLCWHCGYNLRGLASPNCCPECGERYNHEELMDLWQRWCERDG